MFKGKLKAVLFGGLLALGLQGANAAPLKILVINQCGAFTHTNAINWLSKYLTTKVAQKQGWTIVAPTSSANTQSKFRDDTLSTYNVVLWNNNTSSGGVITDATQRAAYEKWVRKGGGTVAWHGFLDHGDLWGFITDSILGGTKFTVHSNWGSNPNAKVRWDTIPMAGETTPRSELPEYAALKTGFPTGQFSYPDEWYSFRSNPRNSTPSATWGGYPRAVDVLMNIDENTYTVPSGGAMGADHPVAWAYKFPKLCDSCVQGRFIFNARGHDSAAFSGYGTNSVANGGDTSDTQKTKNWVIKSIEWAAAGQNIPTGIMAVNAGFNGMLQAQGQNGVLRIQVTGSGKQDVGVYTFSGKKIAGTTGNSSGWKEYSFSNLNHGIYMVRVNTGKSAVSQRVVL